MDLAGGTEVRAGAVILAMGVSYRSLGVERLEPLLGSGVYYGASPSEAPHYAGGSVYLVGAGNSAGQAAIHLAKYAAEVTIVVRGESSRRGCRRISIDEIDCDVEHRRPPRDPGGRRRRRVQLEHLDLRGPDGIQPSGPRRTRCSFSSVRSRDTAWLPDDIARDPHGFVVTGADLSHDRLLDDWTLARAPYPYETSFPGVFAVGDVRSRSVKRVANAVGEGSPVIQYIHTYFHQREKWSALRRPP